MNYLIPNNKINKCGRILRVHSFLYSYFLFRRKCSRSCQKKCAQVWTPPPETSVFFDVLLKGYARAPSNRPLSTFQGQKRISTPYKTMAHHPKQLSMSALGKQGTNQKLSSLLSCQQDFEKVFGETKKEFEHQREFFKFYRKNTKVSASYLDCAWLAKRQSKTRSPYPPKEKTRSRPQTQMQLYRSQEAVIPKTEFKDDLIDFETIWDGAKGVKGVPSKELSRTFNIERVIAAALIKQYMEDVNALPSETLQCEMLIKKVQEKEKGKKLPTMLKAYLVSVLFDKLSNVLSNYAQVFQPLKELVMECLFYGNCETYNSEAGFNHVPYFAVTAYFSQKARAYDEERQGLMRKIEVLKKKKKVIENFATQYSAVKHNLFAKKIMRCWLMKTKRRIKAYWLNVWRSNANDKEILRKSFYQLYQYCKRRSNKKMKVLYNNLSEDYNDMKKSYEHLKRNFEETTQVQAELSAKAEFYSRADYLRLSPISTKPLVHTFFSRFFRGPVISGALSRNKVRYKFRNQDLRKILKNPLQQQPMAKYELSVISDMSIGEYLLNWLSHRVYIGVEGLKEYVKTFGFVQLSTRARAIGEDYNTDPKGYAVRLAKSAQTMTDLYLMDFSNCEILLIFLCSINPRKFSYETLVSVMYQPLYNKLSVFMSALDSICGRSMSDIIKAQDILTNNCSQIVKVIAYLYIAHHQAKPTEKVTESEETYQKTVMNQVYKTLFPFVKAKVSAKSIPDVSAIFGQTQNMQKEIEGAHAEDIVMKVVNTALGTYWKAEDKEEIKQIMDDKKGLKLEKQISVLRTNEMTKVCELYQNDYRNLLLFLTLIAPEYLLDWHKSKKLSQESLALDSARSQMLADNPQKIQLGICRIINRVSKSNVPITLQDLDEKNYKKITAVLVDTILVRPWFLIRKKSGLHPHVNCLKKLYKEYRNMKSNLASNETWNNGKLIQQFIDHYTNNLPLINTALAELEKAQYVFNQLKSKLKYYKTTLLTPPPHGLRLELGSKISTLSSMYQFHESSILDNFAVTDPEAVLEIQKTLGKVFTRNMYHLLNMFNKGASPNTTFTYFELHQFFKFMNVSTFRFESIKLEPCLNHFVKTRIKDSFFTEYFGFRFSPTQIQPMRRPSVVKRQSAPAAIGVTIPGGESVYELYSKYYQYQFSFDEFLQILVEVVFTVFYKEIQGESHGLKSASITKEDSPTKMATFLSNIENFMDRFLQTCASTCSRTGAKNPLKYVNEKIQPVIMEEMRPLIVIYHAIIQKRLKRVVVDKANIGNLMLVSPDDCYILLNEMNAFSTPGFVLEDYKRVIAIVLYGQNYCNHLNEKYEANSKALLSFFDFMEFLYLVAQYMNPNPMIGGEVKFKFLLRHIMYPMLKDKVPELKMAFTMEEYQMISKKRKENALALDKMVFA